MNKSSEVEGCFSLWECVRVRVCPGCGSKRRSFARPSLTSCHCFHIRPPQLFRFVFVLEPRPAAAEGDLALQIRQVGSGGRDIIGLNRMSVFRLSCPVSASPHRLPPNIHFAFHRLKTGANVSLSLG